MLMAIIKKSKIREMADAEMQSRLFEFQRELNTERGMLATGGRTSNPGKIRQLKKGIARMITILHERKTGIQRTASAVSSARAEDRAKIKSVAAPAKPAAAIGEKPSQAAPAQAKKQ